MSDKAVTDCSQRFPDEDDADCCQVPGYTQQGTNDKVHTAPIVFQHNYTWVSELVKRLRHQSAPMNNIEKSLYYEAVKTF